MANVNEVNYSPGISYKCIAGSSINIRDGAGSTYNSIGKLAPNSEILCTKIKGRWAYSPQLGGWVAIETASGQGRYLKQVTDNNSKASTETKDNSATEGNIRQDPQNTGTPETQYTESEKNMLNAAKAAVNEAKRMAQINQSWKQSVPYQSWTPPDWTPQDELGYEKAQADGAGVIAGPITYEGTARASMQELQRISQQDFIIQPNLRKEKRFGMFDRVGIIDPTAKVISTKEYVFFTRPDLHIFKSGKTELVDGYEYGDGKQHYPGLANVPLFVDAKIRYLDVLAQLQASFNMKNIGYLYNSPFMNLLSNNIKSPLDLPAITAEDTSTASNVYGTAITYRDSSEKSDEGYEFNIEFEDNKYLEVYMLFKLYDEYIRKKKLGIVAPKKKYIINKVIHDQFCIYKFLVGEDGESLIYWAKYYGVYPKGVPRDVMNEIQDNKVRFTVPFKCQFMDDMDPQILTDFNLLTNPDGMYTAKMSMPAMDPETQMGNIKFGMVPYITLDKIDENKADVWERVNRFKLRWLEDVNDTSQHRYFKTEMQDIVAPGPNSYENITNTMAAMSSYATQAMNAIISSNNAKK